ncbi:VC0807 family protein [Nonomuraea africana]|uniref:Intracellular septation protein A n=1 Tax=Nonomuraea africana TaxID=46171 RepID=A0ABR9KPN9_9ACTN|nr:VC0807 family protein [Nonomuraea africana]MBE1563993.1 intracellular septation protein A [Nonomuraea africana]
MATDQPTTDPTLVSLPSLMTLARQAAPRLLHDVIVPLAVFYAALILIGLNGALITAVSWVYGNLAWRLIRRQPASATIILTAVAITVRAGLALWTGSAVMYFLQPELGTICVSLVFLVSVRLRRPLVGKLILDYIRLPPDMVAHRRIQRCFVRLTLLWVLVLLLNAGLSIWLLLSQPIGTYLLARPFAVGVITCLAFLGSVWAFRRVLTHLRFPATPASSTRRHPQRLRSAESVAALVHVVRAGLQPGPSHEVAKSL